MNLTIYGKTACHLSQLHVPCTMYKWHVHSAIGRGRPLGGEFSKVADGIAASLRQFHVSAARAAEDGGK
jgi:hypothetical protein